MTDVKCAAALMWADMDENEKAGVRFGLFPFHKCKAAEAAGLGEFDGRELCVALMDCAKADGGMRA